MKFTNADGIKIVYNLIAVIQENRQYLSDIDGAIGDGDHGINMSKGFTLVQNEIKGKELNLTDGLGIISKTLMNKIGGSMGPLYGSIFLGMQLAVKNKEDITDEVIIDMFNKAYDNIKLISPAKPGDKTLVDVLDPAVNILNGEYTKTKDIVHTRNMCKKASTEGMLATKNMQAKIGRASRLGEKSIGHQDAGSTSCSLLINSICDTCMELLK